MTKIPVFNKDDDTWTYPVGFTPDKNFLLSLTKDELLSWQKFGFSGRTEMTVISSEGKAISVIDDIFFRNLNGDSEAINRILEFFLDKYAYDYKVGRGNLLQSIEWILDDHSKEMIKNGYKSGIDINDEKRV